MPDRGEKTAVKLAVTSAIPVGVKHANIIMALAELIAEFSAYLLAEDYDMDEKE
jgi:hypothetical protein